MPEDTYDLIIVGAGPAGLSAAARAKEQKLNALVLEQGEIANTFVEEYQDGKNVMALPLNLDLRSDVDFEEGSRESILRMWNGARDKFELDIRTRVSVRSVEKSNSIFEVKTLSGDAYTAKHVVLAIGKLGNPRKMAAPGGELPHVQYRLRDPKAYCDQDILVVGAGDSAAEVALALAEQNRVALVNRKAELYRMNESLRRQIEQKCERHEMTVHSSADIKLVEADRVTLNFPTEETVVKADHIFVKIGAEVARPFLESCGVTFPSAAPSALPEISLKYETRVLGLYLIGAVTGKDLVKHAMNQGWEVVEHILGHEVEPVDEAWLSQTLRAVQGESVQDKLDHMAFSVPLFGLLGGESAHLRELASVSKVHDVKPGEIIFREGDYSTTVYAIVDGQVDIKVEYDPNRPTVPLGQGDIFGELGLIADRRRTGTVKAAKRSILVEIPRYFMMKLMNAEPDVKATLDDLFLKRATQVFLGVRMRDEDVEELIRGAELEIYETGDIIFNQGDVEDVVYLIRSGSVKISRETEEGTEQVLAYLPSGRYFGEAAILDVDRDTRSATATAARKQTEVIGILKARFLQFLATHPDIKKTLDEDADWQNFANALPTPENPKTELLEGHIKHGVVDATDVLLIDETKCIRCDNCVKACAGTHQGESRLDRVSGPSFGQVHVPVACRHCEGAPCLQDCLPGDAIRREPNGVVMIDENKCVGCNKCAENCPYGVIRMVDRVEKRPFSLLDFVRSKIGAKKEEEKSKRSVAIKCDLCVSIYTDIEMTDPACVQSCPTGAAIRVTSDYFNQVQ